MADAKRLPDGRSSTAIRLDPENYAGLKKASEGFGLPMNFLINYAVREFLARMIEPSLLRLTREPDDNDERTSPRNSTSSRPTGSSR